MVRPDMTPLLIGVPSSRVDKEQRSNNLSSIKILAGRLQITAEIVRRIGKQDTRVLPRADSLATFCTFARLEKGSNVGHHMVGRYLHAK
jgi:hypothetical protein